GVAGAGHVRLSTADGPRGSAGPWQPACVSALGDSSSREHAPHSEREEGSQQKPEPGQHVVAGQAIGFLDEADAPARFVKVSGSRDSTAPASARTTPKPAVDRRAVAINLRAVAI